MKVLLGICCVLFLGLSQHVPRISCRDMPVFSVNLDLPPEERWVEIGKVFSERYLQIAEKLFDAVTKVYAPTPFLREILKIIADRVEDHLPREYALELKGLSKSSKFELWKLVTLNLVGDISSFCTSIVAVDNKGQIWHGRNLDFQYAEYFRNVSVIIDFKKNNKTVFRASTIAGYVGVITAMKPHAFTVSLDSMVSFNPISLIQDIIIEIWEGKSATAMGFLIRDTLLEANDFDSAIQKLAYTTTFSKAYYIVGGLKAKQGAVITKENFKPRDIWYMNQTKAGWFMVETNFYHKDPPRDRRAMAEKLMNKMGQVNFSSKNLFNVLSTSPVRNEITISTTIMSASNPESFHSVVRDNPNGD